MQQDWSIFLEKNIGLSEEKDIPQESQKPQNGSDKQRANAEQNSQAGGENLPNAATSYQQPPTNNQQPATSNQQPETTNLKPETIKMEVHKHPHHITHKKTFLEYALEFALLFLAVFLGFIAENVREHQIERERAKELAHSLYNELKGDSAAFNKVVESRVKKNSSFIFLKKYFRDSSLVNCSKSFAVNFSYCCATYSPSVFEPKDAILQQLKNSGSLRYFKSAELQELISQLSLNISDLRSRNQIELDYVQQSVLPFFIEHNDQEWFDKLGLDSNVFLVDRLKNYEESEEDITFHFRKADDIDRAAAENMVGLYQIIFKGSLLRQYADYEKLNHQLLAALRQEYRSINF